VSGLEGWDQLVRKLIMPVKWTRGAPSFSTRTVPQREHFHKTPPSNTAVTEPGCSAVKNGHGTSKT
jgi:hypothetical protein